MFRVLKRQSQCVWSRLSQVQRTQAPDCSKDGGLPALSHACVPAVTVFLVCQVVPQKTVIL